MLPNKKAKLDGMVRWLVCIKVKVFQNGESVKDIIKSSRVGFLSMKQTGS